MKDEEKESFNNSWNLTPTPMVSNVKCLQALVEVQTTTFKSCAFGLEVAAKMSVQQVCLSALKYSFSFLAWENREYARRRRA